MTGRVANMPGTGVLCGVCACFLALSAEAGRKVEMMTDHMNSRVIGFRGRKSFTYWAGASWSAAGEITTAEAWHAHVREFAAKLGAK